MPFSMVGSVPAAADLMRKVDRTECGLVVDYWHVFRAGTTLYERSASLEASQIFGVELNDAAGEIRGTLFEDTRDNRRPCGQGDQDVTGFIQALKSIGFNGTILWLRAPAQNRRLFEKAEFYEAWATEDRTGFHYERSRRASPSETGRRLRTKIRRARVLPQCDP